MGLAFDGLLGLHIVFALLWIAVSFISARSVMGVIKTPTDTSLKNRALMSQRLVAAAGGITVLVGAGFYYYINYYRPAYATSASGLPLVISGAVLGVIIFAWQMAMGPRVRRALTSTSMNANSSPNTKPVQTTNNSLPKGWMVLLPAVLLILAFALMIGGSMM